MNPPEVQGRRGLVFGPSKRERERGREGEKPGPSIPNLSQNSAGPIFVPTQGYFGSIRIWGFTEI